MTEEFSKKIYKKDTTGKIRVLHVYTDGADLYQDSGVLGGALVSHKSTCVAKNVGRSNETTPEEQAKLEAASKIETKMTTGYFETIEDADKENVILPMLAKDYKKESKKINWDEPVFAQPKLDGQRAIANVHGMISRKGKPIETVAHIIDEIAEKGIYDYFDGELYAHGRSFQENMKLIKKYREGLTEEVKYHVYDLVLDRPFHERYQSLSVIVEHYKHLELVETIRLRSHEHLLEVHKRFLSEGYEGTIVRWGSDDYKINGRSSNLLKFKDFIDIACKIIDVTPSDKRPEHAVFVCEMPDGSLAPGEQFRTGMKFSHDERAEILINAQDYLGQTAEIRFFEYTDDGLPRFPVCVGIRNDK